LAGESANVMGSLIWAPPTCSASESCKSVAEGPALPKLISLAMRGRCRFVRGDDSGGREGDKWTRLNRGELGKEIVPGEGVGDAEGCG
jgi:hypothetical protein